MGDANANKLLYVLCAIAFAAVLFSQLTRERSPGYEPQSSLDEIIRYTRATLEDLQERSITQNQEFCGVVYEDEEGTLHTSRIYDGTRAACAFDWGLPLGNNVVASFHTHGGYDIDFDSEMPSIEDLASDIDARIYGFISTPGGRLWQTDWKRETATQICGEGCLRQDPRYAGTQKERLALSYTFDDLQTRGGYGTRAE